MRSVRVALSAWNAADRSGGPERAAEGRGAGRVGDTAGAVRAEAAAALAVVLVPTAQRPAVAALAARCGAAVSSSIMYT